MPPESIKCDGLLCIDSSSTHGQSLLSIEGKDRETDISTNEITRFGCFSEWLKAFDAKYPDPKDREWLFTKLYVPMPSNSVSRFQAARGKHPLGMINYNDQNAQSVVNPPPPHIVFGFF